MNNNIKVTVILPIYNVEAYIQRCVQSIFDQGYPNIELIAVDDCGTDNSINIVEEMFAHAPSYIDCKLLHHKKNRGLSAARNTGIYAATGDYLLFVDSDDYLLPHCLDHLVRKAQEAKVPMVACDYEAEEGNENFCWHQNEDIDLLSSNSDCLKGFSKLWFTFTAWCKLIDRKFILHNKLYFEEGILNEDDPWMFQMALVLPSMAFLHEKLYHYTYNDNSIMSAAKKQRVIESNEIANRIYLNAINARPELWENKNVYLAFMRHLTIFYGLAFSGVSFANYYKKIQLLSRFRYQSQWFSAKNVPTSYRLWNKMQKVPACIAALATYSMLAIQSKKA